MRDIQTAERARSAVINREKDVAPQYVYVSLISDQCNSVEGEGAASALGGPRPVGCLAPRGLEKRQDVDLGSGPSGPSGPSQRGRTPIPQPRWARPPPTDRRELKGSDER